MEFKQFKIGQNDISRRLDKVIRVFSSSLSLPEIYKAIRKGFIKVNNKKIKQDYRINEGDVIYIASFLLNKENENVTESKVNKSLPLPEIVFENEHLIIINKPYNVNVHGDETSLDKIIEQYYENNYSSSSLSFKPGPLHRLDRYTTGLLVFSKSLEGAHWFSENIKTHVIQKKYYGLATGYLKESEVWKDIIQKNDKDKESFHKVTAKKLSSTSLLDDEKIAETIVRPLKYGKFNNIDVTLIEYTIKTGRKHQIRAQSSLHNHTLLGDCAYGSNKLHNGYQEFYLTAKELTFPKDNPLGLPEKIEIRLPKLFTKILKDCGIEKISV